MQIEHEFTACSTLINCHIDYWCRRGCERDVLVDIFGENATNISDPDYRVSVSLVNRLFELSAEMLNDKTLGLRSGCHLPPTAFGVLGHLIIASNTVRQMLDALNRYCFLMSDIVEVKLITSGEQAKMVYTPNTETNYHHLDSCLSCFVKNSQAIVPGFEVDVFFAHPPYADVEEYRSILGIQNIEFNQAEYAVAFPSAALEHVVGFNKEDDYLVHSSQARAALKKLNIPNEWTKQVKQILATQFYQGEPEVSQVADLLGISVRKLQRELQEEDSSFRLILDETRKELALNYMANGTHPIHDIAFLIGYQETSSFYKAFKRWTGQTPKDYLSDT